MYIVTIIIVRYGNTTKNSSQISIAIVKAGPAAIEAPIAKDSGIVSKPIPINISAPPPFLTAIKSAIVNMIAPKRKKVLR